MIEPAGIPICAVALHDLHHAAPAPNVCARGDACVWIASEIKGGEERSVRPIVIARFNV